MSRPKIDPRRGEPPLANFMQRKQPWIERARCNSVFWLPLPTPIPIPLFTVFFPHDASYSAPRSICKVCPVKRQCLRDAMYEEKGQPLGSRHGMRGGLTPQQRIDCEEAGRMFDDNLSSSDDQGRP